MKAKRLHDLSPAGWGLVLLALLGLMMVVLIHLNPGLVRYAYAPYAYWIIQPEEISEESIDGYAGVRRTFTFTIPEGNPTRIGARLSFYLRHTGAQIEIEDSRLIYDSSESAEPHIGKTPGNYWITVPIRDNYAGKKVRIVLTPLFENVRNETPDFYLIGHEQLLTMILIPREAPMLFLCVIPLLVGLFLCILAFVLPLERADRRSILLLGTMAIAAALWKSSGLSSIALALDMYGLHKEIWYLGAVMYMLTLTLSLRYLLILRGDKAGRREKTCFFLALAVDIVILGLQYLNLLELHHTLIGLGFLLAALHAAVLFPGKPSRPELLWCLLFFFSLMLDMAVLGMSGSLNNAPFFITWVMINLLIQGFGFVRGALQKERVLRERETELKNAKVQAMMQQIRPHFIYNTLTSIYVLCRDDPQQAMQVVDSFTAYLQANFTAIAATKPITFPDELRHTQAYLAVEAMRYGEKLKVEYDLKHTAFRLPALTLQPIVENAVKHGIGSSHTAEEHIVIRSRYQNGTAFLTVEDDGPGFDPNIRTGDAHIGIENVRQRLKLMCGGSMTLESSPEKGTVIHMVIPQKEQSSYQKEETP
ncbi:MAG: histidine kinase [Clostridia bacterium]|nr:histidine kinase [Clostridia bacterium]